MATADAEQGATLFEARAGADGRLVAEPSEAVRRFLRSRDPLREALAAASAPPDSQPGAKSLLAALDLGPEPEWAYLSRIIIATNGNVEAAVKQVLEHQIWQRKTQIARQYLWPGRRVLNNKCDPGDIDALYPLYIRGVDRFGHPVAYAQAGAISTKRILKLVEPEEFVAYHSWLRQRMMWMRDIQLNEEVGQPMAMANYSPLAAQYTVVLDLSGTSLSQVNQTFYALMQQTTHVDQIYHPERMFRTVIVNTPFLFHAVWKVAKGFIDKDTVAKLRICRSDYRKALDEIIDPSQVPSDYGGSGPPLQLEDCVSQVTERFYEAREAVRRKQEAARLLASKESGPAAHVLETMSESARAARGVRASPSSNAPPASDSAETVNSTAETILGDNNGVEAGGPCSRQVTTNVGSGFDVGHAPGQPNGNKHSDVEVEPRPALRSGGDQNPDPPSAVDVDDEHAGMEAANESSTSRTETNSLQSPLSEKGSAVVALDKELGVGSGVRGENDQDSETLGEPNLNGARMPSDSSHSSASSAWPPQAELSPSTPTKAIEPPTQGSKANARDTSSPVGTVKQLQVALLQAHLEFERVERMTLGENEYIRKELVRLQTRARAVASRQGQAAVNAPMSRQNSEMSAMSGDQEVEELELRISRLRQELEATLEESSAHQRAISFARSFIEQESKAAAHDTEYVRLREEASLLKLENSLLASCLDDALGEGSASLLLSRQFM